MWQKWILDLSSGTATVATDAVHEAPSCDFISTDGKAYVVSASADYSTSQLFEIGPGGTLVPGLNANGYIDTLARVR